MNPRDAEPPHHGNTRFLSSTNARRAFGACLGVAVAIAGWEVAARLFIGDARLPPRPRVWCDSVASATVESRQSEEGIAVARYSSCGARLTGRSFDATLPTVVILGDSYVAAREVADGETMGARLAAIAADVGKPVNVRQYGWGGASPAQYVVASRDVVRRWNPRDVVVVLSDDDLGANAIAGMPPRLRLASGGYSIDSTGLTPDAETAPRLLAIGGALERRWAMIIARSPALVRRAIGPLEAAPVTLLDERDIPEVPTAVVRALAEAYGRRLLLVYVADVRATGGEHETTAESRLLLACKSLRVRCVSTRDAMVSSRTAGTLVRGFSNTVAGLGHLNGAGHALVARIMWQHLQP